MRGWRIRVAAALLALAAGASERMRATTAAVRKEEVKEVIVALFEPFGADLTRSGFTWQKPRHKLLLTDRETEEQ